jgi:hypothetical protein
MVATLHCQEKSVAPISHALVVRVIYRIRMIEEILHAAREPTGARGEQGSASIFSFTVDVGALGDRGLQSRLIALSASRQHRNELRIHHSFNGACTRGALALTGSPL